jgi:hypothetical protein
MISSFFGKSKPINSIIVILIVSIIFISIKIKPIFSTLNLPEIAQQFALLLIVILSVFVVDFIVSKNDLTKRNNYALLLFGLFIALIPNSITQSHVLLSNLFILFALRRIISLSSKQNIKKKLFDAAFWIAIASLFYFWAILFFIIVLIALIYYSQNDIKNWIIPFSGLITACIIVVSYNIVMYDYFLPEDFVLPNVSFNFYSLNNLQSIIGITLIVSLLIWCSLFYIKSIKEKTKKLKTSYILIGFSAIIALVVAIISPTKNGSEWIFIFVPLAIIMTNYLERLKEKWFKEILLLLLIITPIVLLVL